MRISLEYQVDRVDQIREQEASSDERAGQPEPSQVGDVLREVLNSLKEGGIELGEKFVGEDVETSDSNFRIAEYSCGNKGEQGHKRDGAEDSEIGYGDGQIRTSVFGKPLEGFSNDGEDRIISQLF